MEDFCIDNDLEFGFEELNSLLKDLKSCFKQGQKNFAKICFCVYNICSYCKDNNFLAKDNEYYDCY